MTPEGNVGRITNETTLSGDVSRGPTPINGLEIPPAPVTMFGLAVVIDPTMKPGTFQLRLPGPKVKYAGEVEPDSECDRCGKGFTLGPDAQVGHGWVRCARCVEEIDDAGKAFEADLIWQWFGYGPEDSARLEGIVRELAQKTGHSVATCRRALAAITWKPAADALHKEGTTLAKAMADLEDGPRFELTRHEADAPQHHHFEATVVATEERKAGLEQLAVELSEYHSMSVDEAREEIHKALLRDPLETLRTLLIHVALDAIALKHGQAIVYDRPLTEHARDAITQRLRDGENVDYVALTTGGRVSSPRAPAYTRAVGRRTITRNSRRFVRPAGKPQIGDAQELAFETQRDLVTGLGATLTGAATFAAGAPWWLAILAGLVVGIGVVGGYEIARRRET